MLQTLHIENFAIIDKITLEFGEGLNVITGETGAGKSIIIEALKLFLGEKPSSSSIRTGEEIARVEALFSVTDEKRREILEATGIEIGEEVLLQREIVSQGKGRCMVDSRPVSQEMLKKLGESLVSISSQHDFQRLLKPSLHSWLLDKFSDGGAARGGYEASWNLWKDARKKLQEHLDQMRNAEREKDFLSHEFLKLEELGLKEGEDEILEEERLKLKDAGKLQLAMIAATDALQGEGGALEKMAIVKKSLSNVNLKEAGRWTEAVNSSLAELEDVSRDMMSCCESLVEDPKRLEEVEERLFAINSLKRKFGSIGAAILRRDEIKGLLSKIENGESQTARLEKEEGEARAKLEKRSKELKALRVKSSARIEKEVEGLLKQLAFSHPKFSVCLEKADELLPCGSEKVEFFFAPNLGENSKPLVEIASGGELSRLHLALDHIAGFSGGLVIYDEVDSGVGGSTASSIGKLLRDAAVESQVICITHLPQIASFGKHHLRVAKEISDKRTRACVCTIKGEERVEEIARLLGGNRQTALVHAKDMLSQFGKV